MTGTRLEVNVHVVTGSASSTQNIVACVNRAGVAVIDTVLEQLAASEAVLTAGREGARRRARRHRRRHHRLRDLRARQPLAHRRRRGRRRSLHQRHRRRAAHADSRRREDQAPLRLRALGDGRRGRDDGGAERRRAQAAGDGAADPVGDPAAARRGDLPPALGRDPARPGSRSRSTPASCSPAAARCSKAWRRSPSRSSTCRSGAACPAGVGGLADHVNSPAFATAVGLVMYAHRNHVGEAGAPGRRRRVRTRGRPAAHVVQGVLLIAARLAEAEHMADLTTQQ